MSPAARPSLRPEQGSGRTVALAADRHAAGAIALLAQFLHIILVGIDDLDRPFVPRVPAVFAVGGVAKVATELLLRFEDVGLVIIPILVHDDGDRFGADARRVESRRPRMIGNGGYRGRGGGRGGRRQARPLFHFSTSSGPML